MTVTDSEGYFRYLEELRSTLNMVRAAPTEWHGGSAVRAASLELAHELVGQVHAASDGAAGKEALWQEALTLAGAVILQCREVDPTEYPYGGRRSTAPTVRTGQHVAH